jgi:hypothetical protein
VAAAPAVPDREAPAVPGSGRPGWLPLLLYPLVALLSFPTLGHLLFRRAGYAYKLDTFDLPHTGTGADWLANGIQLWNTHITGGNALLAQQSSNPFAFDVALESLIGRFAAYVVFVWLLATVAGIGMHLFLRDSMRLGPVATVAGSVVYLFSFWLYIYGFAAPAIPLLFWLMDRAVQPGPRRWRFVVGSVLVTALVLYHGISQIIGLVAVVLLLWTVVTRRPGERLWPRLVTFFAIWGLALAIYAPVIVTQLVMLPLSNRSFYAGSGVSGPSSIIDALRALVTDYSSVLAGVPVTGQIGLFPGRYGIFFMGAIGLPLVALALVGRRPDRKVLFLALLVVALPAWDILTYLAGPILSHLGFLRSYQLDRLRHVLPFALAGLFAVGCDVFATTVLAGKRLQLGRRALVVVGLASAPAVLAGVVALVRVVNHRHALRTLAASGVGWALLVAALAVGLAMLGWALWAASRTRDGTARRAGAVLLGVLLVALVGERALYAWGIQLVDTPGYHGTWARTLALTPAERFLKAQPGIGVERVLQFGGTANSAAAVDLLEVGGYGAIYPETYHQFFGTMIAPELAGDRFHYAYYWNWGNRVITFGPAVDPELVELSGARWLLVHDGSVPTVPGIVERFHSGHDTVYEVPSVLPRAFLAGAVHVADDQASLLAAMASADRATLGATAYATPSTEGASIAALGLPASATAPAGDATIARYTPDRVEIDVKAAGPAVLVLTDVAAPGWVAERDGVQVPISTVDETFRGVAVDAGTHTVVFSYRPGFTYAGFVVAALALVVTIVAGVVVRRRDLAATGRREDT